MLRRDRVGILRPVTDSAHDNEVEQRCLADYNVALGLSMSIDDFDGGVACGHDQGRRSDRPGVSQFTIGISPDSYQDMTAPPGCTNRGGRSTRRKKDNHRGGVRRAASQTAASRSIPHQQPTGTPIKEPNQPVRM